MLRVSTALFLAAVLGAVSSRGPLVLIGGGLEEDNEAIWGRMLSEAGGEGVSEIDPHVLTTMETSSRFRLQR